MTGRIQGIFLIVNTLLVPVIAALLFALVAVQGQKIAVQWQQVKAPLIDIAKKAAVSAGQVQDVAERTTVQVEQAVAQIDGVATALGNVKDGIAKPIDTVAALKVPTVRVSTTDLKLDLRVKDFRGNKIGKYNPLVIKNVLPTVSTGSADFGKWLVAPFTPIVDALGKLSGPMTSLRQAVTELEKLKALEPQVTAFQRQIGQAAAMTLALAEEVWAFTRLLAILLAGLGIWFVAGFLFWAVQRLRRGWSLICGRGDPSATAR